MAFGALKGTFTGTANSITNPFAATGSVAVVVGDAVVAVLGEQIALTVTAVTDNLGNTYVAVNAGTDGGSITGRAFYSRVTVAGTITSLNATTTGSTNNVAFVGAAIEGPFMISPLDAAPANNNNTDNASPFTCPATGTLAQANEVVISWMCGQSNATWLATSPNLKAIQAISQSVADTIIGYQVVAATTSIAPEFTGTNPTASVQGTFSLKQAAQAFSIVAGVGAYAITGTAATPELGRRVSADAGSYAISGSPVGLLLGKRVVAGGGTYAIVGETATLRRTWRVGADTEAYVVVGSNVNLALGGAGNSVAGRMFMVM